MAHPFFETTKFPFYRNDAKALLEALVTITILPAAITDRYDKSGPALPPLTPARPDLMWSEAVRELTSHGYLRTFCEHILAGYAGQKEILDVVNAVINAQPANLTRIISKEVLILDKTSLRKNIETIGPANAPKKIIIVRGDTQSGKSWGRHLFELTAWEAGATPIYLYDGIIPTLKHTLDQLYSAIDPSKKAPPIDTTDPAWYQTVCLELQALAVEQEKVVWIAVDDLGEKDNAPLIDSKIKDFFDKFANNMMNPPFRKSFRLMLINYPSKIPTQWKRETYIENEAKISEIREIEIEEILKEWRTITGKVLTDENITNIATDIMAAATVPLPEENPPSKLERIHELLKERLQTL